MRYLFFMFLLFTLAMMGFGALLVQNEQLMSQNNHKEAEIFALQEENVLITDELIAVKRQRDEAYQRMIEWQTLVTTLATEKRALLDEIRKLSENLTEAREEALQAEHAQEPEMLQEGVGTPFLLDRDTAIQIVIFAGFLIIEGINIIIKRCSHLTDNAKLTSGNILNEAGDQKSEVVVIRMTRQQAHDYAKFQRKKH